MRTELRKSWAPTQSRLRFQQPVGGGPQVTVDLRRILTSACITPAGLGSALAWEEACLDCRSLRKWGTYLKTFDVCLQENDVDPVRFTENVDRFPKTDINTSRSDSFKGSQAAQSEKSLVDLQALMAQSRSGELS